MTIPDHILNRTGARNTASVPDEVLSLLNQGKIETANLCEWLVVDQLALASIVFKNLGWENHFPNLEKIFSESTPKTAPKKTFAIGKYLTSAFPSPDDAATAAAQLASETSDSARAWGAYLIGLHPQFSLQQKFELIRPFAADRHMDVPEIAWLALREVFIENFPETLDRLKAFVLDPNDRIRRFASELTRPRGVWCRHVLALKNDPSPGIALLEPLKSDPSNYVRLSVGNWLNDASKSAPDLVLETCSRWEKQSPTKETAHIVGRALRTLKQST